MIFFDMLKPKQWITQNDPSELNNNKTYDKSFTKTNHNKWFKTLENLVFVSGEKKWKQRY